MTTPHKKMLCLGLNYRSATVGVRERFSVPAACLPEVCRNLCRQEGVAECLLLSTCNRTELYFWADDAAAATEAVMSYYFGAPEERDESLASCFYLLEEREALLHLCRVASGLDSMVVGETEIFGQLKDAYRLAHEVAATTGRYSNRVFQQVFSLGKKVRTQSNITSGPTSVGAASVQMAQDILVGLDGKRVLIVGAGDVARTTAQSLKSRGAEGIFVANRSYDKAVELAAHVGGEVIRFADWVPYLEEIDIVIVSTASPVYVVSPHQLEPVLPARAGRPLFLVDLSVPRNVDPACSACQGVHVFDMDALETMTQETRRIRQTETAACEVMIQTWLAENANILLEPKKGPDSACAGGPIL